jgi:hypothetical protein
MSKRSDEGCGEVGERARNKAKVCAYRSRNPQQLLFSTGKPAGFLEPGPMRHAAVPDAFRGFCRTQAPDSRDKVQK